MRGNEEVSHRISLSMLVQAKWDPFLSWWDSGKLGVKLMMEGKLMGAAQKEAVVEVGLGPTYPGLKGIAPL